MLVDLSRRVAACSALLFAAIAANAQLEIEITEYAGKQTPVAVVPFGWEGQDATAPFDISAVIAADLRRSGRFAPLPENDMLQKPVAGVEVDLFRPDEELKRLAKLAVESGVADAFSAGDVEATCQVLKSTDAGNAWIASFQESAEPWFNF